MKAHRSIRTRIVRSRSNNAFCVEQRAADGKYHTYTYIIRSLPKNTRGRQITKPRGRDRTQLEGAPKYSYSYHTQQEQQRNNKNTQKAFYRLFPFFFAALFQPDSPTNYVGKSKTFLGVQYLSGKYDRVATGFSNQLRREIENLFGGTVCIFRGNMIALSICSEITTFPSRPGRGYPPLELSISPCCAGGPSVVNCIYRSEEGCST